MRKILAKKIGYPVQDLIKRTQILKEKDFLLKSQFWSVDKMYNYRLNKLKNIVKFAYDTVPYYRKTFDRLGITPTDIKDLSDINILPVLTKEVALKENINLLSNHTFNNLKIGKTGGTTGTPLMIKSNTNTRSIVWGAYYRWYDWMHIDIGDPVVSMWGATTVTSNSFLRNLKEKSLFYLQNNYRINSFEMNRTTLPSLVKNIKNKKPKIIKGYLSALLQLADYVDDNNIEGIEPSALSSTSETLYPHFRSYLERVFNSTIYDQYGCGECQSIAFECKSHQGMHITEEHVIVEVLDLNNSNLINQNGRIILTDLDNYAMPFLRYENGDTGNILSEKCSCGIKHQMMGRIAGRTADTITLKDGSKVHGVFFTDVFFELRPNESRKISRFQAYQEKAGEVELRIESKIFLDNSFLNELKVGLDKYFNKIVIVVVDKIENETSGKFKYIKSKID